MNDVNFYFGICRPTHKNQVGLYTYESVNVLESSCKQINVGLIESEKESVDLSQKII